MASRRRIASLLSVGVALLATLFVMQYGPVPAEPSVPKPIVEPAPEEEIAIDGEVEGVSDTLVETNATVVAVSDGDTFTARLDDTGEEVRVRMLGVDTPETVDPRKPVQCFGKEASNFTKHLLADARVRLDPDPLADERDKYGRLLRNVTTEDGVDLNAHLVQEGYAHAYLSFPLDPFRKKQLTDLEAAAKAEGRGLWGETCTNL
jgi:micrococcal nuclease